MMLKFSTTIADAVATSFNCKIWAKSYGAMALTDFYYFSK
jgi:hypothetical protein